MCPAVRPFDQDGQGSFQKSLVEIGSLVSEEKIFFNFIPPFSIFSLAAILVGSRDPRTQFWKIEKGGMKLKKIFSFETREPISTKLC
jgi:hypothetical protein